MYVINQSGDVEKNLAGRVDDQSVDLAFFGSLPQNPDQGQGEHGIAQSDPADNENPDPGQKSPGSTAG